jgi:uncharacterized protein (DUF849 family)
MAATDKVIITCAITGAIHTPTMSPYLPITPDQIAAEAIAAAEAGAAILHLHARDPQNGRPDQTPEAFARFLPRIKQGTNAAINITTGGSPYMRVEERVRPAATFKPEVASLNMGSINFGLYHLLPKYKEFKSIGRRRISRPRATWSFATASRTSNSFSQLATTTAPVSNSNATTSHIFTIWRISPTASSSNRRSSSNPCLVFSAASARMPKTSRT